MGGGEGGEEDVAAGEQLLVGHGGLVVVVEAPALADLDVEQLPDTGGTEDALGGSADLAGVDEGTGADAILEGDQAGFGAGDELGGADRVASVPFEAGHHHGAAPVGEGHVTGRRTSRRGRCPPVCVSGVA